MSARTIYVCDLCQEQKAATDLRAVDFDFGDCCAFKGDACDDCAGRLRSACRSANRYSYRSKWPSFYPPEPEPAPVEAVPAPALETAVQS